MTFIREKLLAVNCVWREVVHGSKKQLMRGIFLNQSSHCSVSTLASMLLIPRFAFNSITQTTPGPNWFVQKIDVSKLS